MTASGFTHLVQGRTYRVAQPFTDFDHRAHAVGDVWTYSSESFLPYDDGLSLFVSINGEDQQIRMCLHPEEQGPLIQDFAAYLVEE
ncbi:MAG: hypothetical protein K0R83_2511 [Caulobacter sp.]|nr:hypothetical protein [Caulobacter sp.]